MGAKTQRPLHLHGMPCGSLVCKSKNLCLAHEVFKVESFWGRGVGLMGKKPSSLKGRSLWLVPCGSVHTCFMRFAISVIFVDRNLRVVTLFRAAKPWRLFLGAKSATSVFELSTGSIKALQVGDQLHVGS